MGKTTVTLTGDEHRLLKALDKVVQKESELARAAEAAGRKTVGANMMVRKSYRDVDRAVDRHRNKVKQAAAAREKAVGASAVGQLAAFAGAWRPASRKARSSAATKKPAVGSSASMARRCPLVGSAERPARRTAVANSPGRWVVA